VRIRDTGVPPVHDPREFHTARMKAFLFCLLLVAAFAPAASLDELAAPKDVIPFDLPDGFAQQLIADGITGATGMAIAPDGRIFVCEQTGALRVVKDDKLLPDPFLRLDDLDTTWERGLIGVTLDPGFTRNGFVYVCSVHARPYPHHVISRFTADPARPDRALAGSEFVLLEGDDQSKLGGSIPAGHQGGALRFGADGKLYAAIGEQTAGEPSQRLDTLQGKLLRLNPDGSIPPDNPFLKSATGKYRAIWAYGLRNPFTLAVQPRTGRIFVNDVGASRWEEIDEGAAGANYGWPLGEGPTDDPRFRGPVHAYAESAQQSIAGGTFYDPPPSAWQFPDRYVGKYFFADFIQNWVRVIDPRSAKVAELFAANLAGPVALEVGPDGCLYVLNRNAWVKDDHFRPRTGTLHRVFYVANALGRPAPVVTRPPRDATVVAGGPARFEVKAVGAAPIRYQWLRDGKRIESAADGALALPRATAGDDGAVLQCVVSNAFGAARSRPAVLRVAPPREPDVTGPVAPGLAALCYEGAWGRLPALDALKPARTSVVADLATPAPAGARSLRGALRIERGGSYTFVLDSPGPAKLFVSGEEVAPGSPATVGLQPGLHSLRVDSVAAEGKAALTVLYSGPDFARRPIPPGELFHETGPRTTPPARPLATTLNLPPANPSTLPRRLSGTGIFRSLTDLDPEPGLVAYDVNVPQWFDGARARHWLALRGNSRIALGRGGPWRFPAGAVLVQHFDTPRAGRPAETRVLVCDGAGSGYAATYRWRADGADADLAADSTASCLVCHSRDAGFVLGASARQLNNARGDLLAWCRAGLFDPPVPESVAARAPRLVPVSDGRAPLADRARSYLDANCSHCHRPGGVRAEFDARFETPIERQNLLGARPVAGDLGIAGALVVAPGDRSHSVLWQRLNRRGDAFRMPPLDAYDADSAAVDVIGRWIDGLPAAPAK
jgi:glucose/arabinose dehydrogenase